MPDKEVQTIRDLIYYQYAKIIARRAFSSTDGVEAKQKSFGFIKHTFRKLKNGEMSWSDITRVKTTNGGWQIIKISGASLLHLSDHVVENSHGTLPGIGI